MTPLNKLTTTLKQTGLIKFLSHFAEQFSDIMLKDLSMGSIGEDRKVDFLGKTVTNFGSDSFLGLDQDERIKDALRNGIERWGSHNGASRAFSSV